MVRTTPSSSPSTHRTHGELTDVVNHRIGQSIDDIWADMKADGDRPRPLLSKPLTAVKAKPPGPPAVKTAGKCYNNKWVSHRVWMCVHARATRS